MAKATPEQETQLKKLLSDIGPKSSMHIFSNWLNDSVQSGSASPQFRDSVSGVVTSLRDAEQNIRDY